jgi:NAD(P)-dependent dehydrogenase (short-subunit alcohol dehydrogenase family)
MERFMNLKDKSIIVTGGSRGLGLGLVEALVARDARVTVVARDTDALEAVRTRLGAVTIAADVTDEMAAHRIVDEVQPDILVLNAGTKPRTDRLDKISWADFSAPWETDVKAGLYWLQAALNLPLRPGSRVLVGSSGAAHGGSPLSGGYAGAKRMLWFMAKYANAVSAQKGLGIRVQAILPMQMVGGTGVGDAGASAYARAAGLEPSEFLVRSYAPMPPRDYGEKVAALLEEAKYAEALALGIKGDTGITILEAAAA